MKNSFHIWNTDYNFHFRFWHSCYFRSWILRCFVSESYWKVKVSFSRAAFSKIPNSSYNFSYFSNKMPFLVYFTHKTLRQLTTCCNHQTNYKPAIISYNTLCHLGFGPTRAKSPVLPSAGQIHQCVCQCSHSGPNVVYLVKHYLSSSFLQKSVGYNADYCHVIRCNTHSTSIPFNMMLNQARFFLDYVIFG
jgi:hypothetical protein